jgi:Transcription termination factor nusG
MSYWAAVRCRSQREITIAERLEGLGCAIYLPRARMRLGRSLQPATIPTDRTYFFADVDQGPPWQAICRQPGVVGLVMTGDAPSHCPESEILKLKAAEVNGLDQLADPPSSARRFGEKVKIRFGAAQGLRAGLPARPTGHGQNRRRPAFDKARDEGGP